MAVNVALLFPKVITTVFFAYILKNIPVFSSGYCFYKNVLWLKHFSFISKMCSGLRDRRITINPHINLTKNAIYYITIPVITVNC